MKVNGVIIELRTAITLQQQLKNNDKVAVVMTSATSIGNPGNSDKAMK